MTDIIDENNLADIRHLIFNLVDTSIENDLWCNNRKFRTEIVFFSFVNNNDYEAIDYIMENFKDWRYDNVFEKLYENKNYEMIFYLIDKFYACKRNMIPYAVYLGIDENDVDIFQKCLDLEFGPFDSTFDQIERHFLGVCEKVLLHNDFRIFNLYRKKSIYTENMFYRVMSFCTNKGKDIRIGDKYYNSYDIFKLLIDNQIGNPEQGLLIALEKDSYYLVEMFVNFGVISFNDISLNDNLNKHIEKYVNDPRITKLLLQNGCKLEDEPAYIRKICCRYHTDQNDLIELLNLLIENGANLNIFEIKNLNEMLLHRKFLLINFLIDHHVDFTQLNNFTPSSDLLETIHKLETNGVNMQQLTYFSLTDL
jgi:hypothetical protein